MSNLMADIFRTSELNTFSVITCLICMTLAAVYCYKNSTDLNTMFKSVYLSSFIAGLVGILGRVSHLF